MHFVEWRRRVRIAEGSSHFNLALLHGSPKLVIDDPQMRYLRHDLAVGRIEARDTAASGWMLYEPLPAPD
jgi:hypothetical protein